ncbi:MAG: PAS domain S-box protein [Methanoregula sp.]
MADTLRILYVDDEPTHLDIGKIYLERAVALTVDTVTSASEALTLLNTERYDAIISDYMMPEMDGIAFLRQLKASGNTTPFIIFTGRGREEIAIQALNNGADFYIQKGGEPKSQYTELSNKVRYAVSRRRAEETLAESEERYRGILERSSDVILILDKEVSPTYVSPSARSIIGYDPEELVGKPKEFAVATIFSQSSQAFMDGIHANMKGESIDISETQIRKKNGGVIYVNVHSVPIMHEGAFAGAQVSMRDITERVRAEQAFGESERKYRNLVETITDWVWEIDLEGTHTYSNPAVLNLLGYQVSEIVGSSIFPHIHPDDEIRIGEMIASCIEDKDSTPYTTTIRWLKKDGSVRLFESAITPIVGAGGEITGFRGIDRDVTERKRSEDAMLQMNKKLTMLNGITRHDILNKLMALRTYLELSKEAGDNPDFLEYVRKEEEIVEAIEGQIEFTSTYQDIGAQAPKWQSLLEVIHSASGELKPRNVKINNSVAGREIFADPLITKVFYNIMENSLRHGESVTEMEYAVQEKEDNLIIIYRDNGKGIPAEDKKNIFEKGFGRHTGLGLFLSKEILSITGITILENGEPGKGARFEMAVPKGMWRLTSGR